MRQQEWLDHFKKQEEQGISGSRYCRENSLSQSQFSYWRNKLKNKPRLTVMTRLEHTMI
ncbi:MAG: hypothetical protein KA436_12570 [Oligoflexales bacterium]|nr:hypothetical protein [Oligoflexales bacterium]